MIAFATNELFHVLKNKIWLDCAFKLCETIFTMYRAMPVRDGRRGSVVLKFARENEIQTVKMRFAVCTCLLALFATVNWLSSAELTKKQREKLCSRKRDGCKSKYDNLSLCPN